MMSIESIRRINFALLRKEDSLTSIADKTGIGITYLARMESGDRGFTEKKARQIERKLGLPKLWLDGEHEKHSPILAEAVRELEHVPENLLPAVLAAIRALKRKD